MAHIIVGHNAPGNGKLLKECNLGKIKLGISVKKLQNSSAFAMLTHVILRATLEVEIVKFACTAKETEAEKGGWLYQVTHVTLLCAGPSISSSEPTAQYCQGHSKNPGLLRPSWHPSHFLYPISGCQPENDVAA